MSFHQFTPPFWLFFQAASASQPNLSAKEDFSDLPPNQRKKRLQQKIDEINQKVRHR